MSDVLGKLLGIFLRNKNQFNCLYQQNRRKEPAEMYLFNLNYRSATAHVTLVLSRLKGDHSYERIFPTFIRLFTNSQAI